MTQTKHTNQSLHETFVTGLSGIISIAGYRKTFFSNKLTIIPIVSSIVISLMAVILKLDILQFLLEVKSLMINFLPGILGFTIAGYSLMVGFIQSGLLDKITEPSNDSKFSLYQKMSSTFAVNILIQAAALVIAYTIHFINYIDSNRKLDFQLNEVFIKTINIIGLTIAIYWFIIALLMIIQIVVNIFGFSQLHHYYINKLKVDAKDKSNSAGEAQT